MLSKDAINSLEIMDQILRVTLEIMSQMGTGERTGKATKGRKKVGTESGVRRCNPKAKSGSGCATVWTNGKERQSCDTAAATRGMANLRPSPEHDRKLTRRTRGQSAGQRIACYAHALMDHHLSPSQSTRWAYVSCDNTGTARNAPASA